MSNMIGYNAYKVKLKEPYLEITGGKPLEGTVEIEGAKNASLPAIVAACLSAEPVLLKNVPTQLNDVKQITQLLIDMGVDVKIDHEKKTIQCKGRNWTGGQLNGEIAGKIRHSLLLIGLSVAWKKDIFLPMPGGCDLGNRKHDMHVDAMKALNNQVTENEGIEIIYKEASDKTIIDFYYPTFGGTFNALFASVKQFGKTVQINNAARNPEVIDVIEMLTKMGAKINWLDETTLQVKGVKELKGITHSIMPDRIIGATVIAATGVTKGNVILRNFKEDLLASEIEVWRKSGLQITQKHNNLHIDGNVELTPSNVATKAYPGFHTDIQPLHTLLMSTAKGESVVKETILDGRFKYCTELNKMGANIKVVPGDFKCVNGAQGHIAKITGVERLLPAEVKATDIRGGAAVAVAALAAKGTSVITNLYQLERGYGNFVEMFNSLGANITRIDA